MEEIMKMVVAIIRPDKFQQTKQALEELGISGMTVSDVRGHGRQKGHTEFYRGSEHQVDLMPKVRLEIATAGDETDKVINAIIASSQTGRIGDGKIFIWPMEEAVRVRTGEKGEEVV
jgi:nitrogen regulatory protein PII